MLTRKSDVAKAVARLIGKSRRPFHAPPWMR